jgi:hypothetical protein
MPSNFHLVMRAGPTAGKVFPLVKGEVIIGRDLNNEIVINDPEISRRHARLYVQGNTYVLEDLGSTNGTFVGGARLTGPYPLRIGEVITFGERMTMVFESGQPETDATVVAAPPAVAPQVAFQMPVQPEVSAPVKQAPVQPRPAVPTPQPVYQPPAPVAQPVYQSQAPLPPPPVYAGQVPYAAEEPAKPKRRTTLVLIIILAVILLLGCICLVVVLWNAPASFWCQFPVWPEGACP